MTSTLNFFIGQTNGLFYALRPYVMAIISLFALFSGNFLLQASGLLLALPTFYIFKARN